MPSGLTNEERNYLKGLKSGMNFDVSIFYHLKGLVGIGFKYSNYSASSERRFSFVDNAGYTYSGKFTTKDMITFFGPSFIISNFNEETKHKMYVDLALGAVTYTTKSGNVKCTGSSLGSEMNGRLSISNSQEFFNWS